MELLPLDFQIAARISYHHKEFSSTNQFHYKNIDSYIIIISFKYLFNSISLLSFTFKNNKILFNQGIN